MSYKILLVQFIIDGPKMRLHKVKVLRNILDFINKMILEAMANDCLDTSVMGQGA